MATFKKLKMAADPELQSIIDEVNAGYEAVHLGFEEQVRAAPSTQGFTLRPILRLEQYRSLGKT